MHKEIKTDRLVIRPLKSSDSYFILKLLNSPGWLKYIEDRNIGSIEQAEAYIQKILGNKGYFYHVFERIETGQAMGIITFLNRDNQDVPDLGFAILSEFENQGYTFEASQKYLEDLLLHTSHQKIIAITLSDNKCSIGLLTKLGFTFEREIMEEKQILSIYALKV